MSNSSVFAFLKHKETLVLFRTRRFNNQYLICLRTQADKEGETPVGPDKSTSFSSVCSAGAGLVNSGMRVFVPVLTTHLLVLNAFTC